MQNDFTNYYEPTPEEWAEIENVLNQEYEKEIENNDDKKIFIAWLRSKGIIW